MSASIDAGHARDAGVGVEAPTVPQRTVAPWAVDVLVAAATFGASLVNLTAQDDAGFAGIPLAGYVLLAMGSIALVWRRRWPVAVFGVTVAMTILWTSLGYPSNPVLHILVALYSIGRYVVDWRIGVPVVAVAIGIIGLGQAVDNDSVTEVIAAAVLTVLPWYVGRRVRLRADYAAAAQARAEFLEWKRAADAQRTIDDARAAIARELHDVVAHNVSLMTVQAGMARLVVREDPNRAEEAIAVVEKAGRSALDELRHLLGVLRPETPADDLGPQPGLDQLPALVEQLRAAGIETSLSVAVVSQLPDRIDLFTYRIVQEALTNVLKHGGDGATADVRIQEFGHSLEIEVVDTGHGATQLPGAGRGLVGMRERTVLLGGTFDAGPRLGGGFRVFCRIPIGDR